MFSSIQPFAILAGGTFALMILVSVVGGIVERPNSATGTMPAETERLIVTAGALLFVVLCFSVMPLFLRAFTVMQGVIGNSELAMVKFIREHERTITYVVWGILVCAFAVALPSMMRDVWTDTH